MFSFDSPVPYIFIAVVLGFVGYSLFRNHKIKANGIETDAVISRVEESDSTDSDGSITTTYTYYVRYKDQDGNGREAVLTNTYTRRNFVMGDPVKIKYLPGKEKTAVLV